MYLENNNIFYKYQFGFRANYSTNHILTEITEQIRNARDKGLYTCGAYLDLQKTYLTQSTTIFHQQNKKHYGIKGTSFGWFKSFICDRIQQTSIDLKESSTQSVSHGVPQSSVLGRSSAFFYFHDLNNSVKNSKVHYQLMIQTYC